jgi:hypothetical protein
MKLPCHNFLFLNFGNYRFVMFYGFNHRFFDQPIVTEYQERPYVAKELHKYPTSMKVIFITNLPIPFVLYFFFFYLFYFVLQITRLIQ